MPLSFAKAIHIPGGEYGNALVSRYPIRSVRALPIVTTPEERDTEEKYEDRVLLIAEIELAGSVLFDGRNVHEILRFAYNYYCYKPIPQK